MQKQTPADEMPTANPCRLETRVIFTTGSEYAMPMPGRVRHRPEPAQTRLRGSGPSAITVACCLLRCEYFL